MNRFAADHPPSAAPRRRRRFARLLPIAMAVVVTQLVLAACGPSARTSARPPVEAASVTPRPSSSPTMQNVAIAALVEKIATGKLSYRLAFKGKISASANTLPIAGTMDVSGADFTSSFTYDFSRDYDHLGTIRVQVRAVKGKGYIKRASAAWKAVKNYDAGDSYVPFKAVKAVGDIRYLGPVEIGERTFHRVSVPGAVLIHPNTIPFQIQKEKIDEVTLEVVIDDAGRPRSGTWNLRGQARVGPSGGQLQRVVYDLDLKFSKVGAKLTIKRP